MVSRMVLVEAERNIQAKLGEDSLLRFYRAIGEATLDIVAPPTAAEIVAHSRIISLKDAHMLAAALKGGADLLLTLDRRHFFSPKVVRGGLPFQVMTPGDFLRTLIR